MILTHEVLNNPPILFKHEVSKEGGFFRGGILSVVNDKGISALLLLSTIALLRKCLEKAVVDLRMKVECISMFQAPMKMYTRIAKIFDSFQF